ncbi:GntR family transcriptional regulator [Martelella alba]|uniref:GntR family transcriptional regulator n=1 Tax=Martelella alba TaxID=2590451 RepID=A0ABY2SGM8_9HYPH|nr:GntR family transcriptional regulator [Martelella alba]TKI04321.1 GntR family transcriptional regulator [Martelella alba]
MEFRIDRSLAIPLGIQLRGLIEYGITFGALEPGDRLPSVRDMAARVDVAPMTVAQVYRELQEANLIYSKPGAGNYIADASAALGQSSRYSLIEQADALIRQGLALGVSAGELTALLQTRLRALTDEKRPARIVMVGNFLPPTQDYARQIGEGLAPDVQAEVEAATVNGLREDETLRRRCAAADLVLTFAHRRREVTELLPTSTVVAIRFIPSAETRQALASIDPLAQVAVVSIFPEFTPLMEAGVGRFASHVASVTVLNQGAPQLDACLRRADVLVYATGAQALAARIGAHASAFEYRHVPDAGDIQHIVKPLLIKAL